LPGRIYSESGQELLYKEKLRILLSTSGK